MFRGLLEDTDVVDDVFDPGFTLELLLLLLLNILFAEDTVVPLLVPVVGFGTLMIGLETDEELDVLEAEVEVMLDFEIEEEEELMMDLFA